MASLAEAMQKRREAQNVAAGDRRTVAAAHATLSGKSRGIWRVLPFLGPAFIASVAYIDPGNFATNIQGGSAFGYQLLWVIFASNLFAVLLQTLSAKLGIATGMNLPEVCAKHLPRQATIGLWLMAELAAMATDLAEFVGAALGFNLLLHIPLFLAGLLTGLVTFLLLGMRRFGFRPLEAVIFVLIVVIAGSYLVEVVLARPDAGQIAFHTVTPLLSGNSVLLAVGILGATVMPHVVYLHSALTQHRIVPGNDQEARRVFRFEQIDIWIAMGLAGLVNGAMLIMAASVFFGHGFTGIATIQDALPDADSAAGSGGGHRLRAGAAGLWAVVFDGGHDGGPGDHAGLHRLAHCQLAAAADYDASGADCAGPWRGPDGDAGHQPGGAELRAALCDCAAAALHAPPRHHGRAGEPPPDDGAGRISHAGDYLTEYAAALAGHRRASVGDEDGLEPPTSQVDMLLVVVYTHKGHRCILGTPVTPLIPVACSFTRSSYCPDWRPMRAQFQVCLNSDKMTITAS